MSGASAVLCLSPTYSGGFASGGADGIVRVWDESLDAKGAAINISEVILLCLTRYSTMHGHVLRRVMQGYTSKGGVRGPLKAK